MHKKIRGLADDIKKFANNISSEIPKATDAMKIFNEEMKSQGYDGFDAENKKREAVSKGFASMNQDQASDLNGKFT